MNEKQNVAHHTVEYYGALKRNDRDEERSPHRDEEWPPLAVTRESPRTNRRPNTAKNK